eukprot:3860292-Heterocapsa_arctica.AAC.1
MARGLPDGPVPSKTSMSIFDVDNKYYYYYYYYYTNRAAWRPPCPCPIRRRNPSGLGCPGR